MILYCDTSALIKRYVEEDGTDQVDELWDKSEVVSTSVVAFAESMATFRRKFREGMFSKKEYDFTINKFKEDYRYLILIPVNAELNNIIERLISKYQLRGFDAIHLASAMVFNRNDIVLFACFDERLNVAAKEEGLRTIEC